MWRCEAGVLTGVGYVCMQVFTIVGGTGVVAGGVCDHHLTTACPLTPTLVHQISFFCSASRRETPTLLPLPPPLSLYRFLLCFPYSICFFIVSYCFSFSIFYLLRPFSNQYLYLLIISLFIQQSLYRLLQNLGLLSSLAHLSLL